MRLRPIRPADKDALQDHFLALSPETVHKRFLGLKRRLSSGELRHLTEVDGHSHVALVAELDHDQRPFVAVGRWVREPGDHATAEFAIVVADDLHGCGLGSILADALALTAKHNGVSRFTANVLTDNVAIMRVMARLASQLDHSHVGMGVSEVAFDLAA